MRQLLFPLALGATLLTGCSECRVEAGVAYLATRGPEESVRLYALARYYVCTRNNQKDRQDHEEASRREN
jgi:hypothetical protein